MKRPRQTPIDPHAALTAYIATAGTQTQAAAQLGVSLSYLNDLLHKRRAISRAMLERLGLSVVVVQR